MVMTALGLLRALIAVRILMLGFICLIYGVWTNIVAIGGLVSVDMGIVALKELIRWLKVPCCIATLTVVRSIRLGCLLSILWVSRTTFV